MANDVNVDTLSIQISSDVEPAARSLGSLASAVKRFNDAVAKGNGFADLVTLANQSKTAADNMKDAPAKITELAASLREFGQACKSVKISKDLTDGLRSIGEASQAITDKVSQRLRNLADGLTAIRDVGEVRIDPSVGNGIAAINDALDKMNVNNMSKIGRFVEAVQRLHEISGLTISGTIAREMVNIGTAAELLQGVDFTPIRNIVDALGYLPEDIRIPASISERIVDLGVAADTVRDVDWSTFERMAAGLRSLEGLGEIRIPRIRGAAGGNQNQAQGNGEAITGTQDTPLVSNVEETGDAAAHAEPQISRFEQTMAALGRTMGNVAHGFVQGAGIAGTIRQIQEIFSSPGNAVGYGIGAAIRGIVGAIGELGQAARSIGIKAFKVGMDGLRSVLNGIGNAATAACKGLLTLGKAAAKVFGTIAKFQFKGLMALPKMLASGIIDRIKKASKAANGFVRSIGRIAFYRLIRSAVKEVTAAFGEGIKNLYQWSLLVDHTFANSMNMLATSAQYLKNSLAAMVSPLINQIAPAIDLIVDKFVNAINMVNQFLAAITGSETFTAAKKVATEWAENETEKANKNLKDLKKTILGFDELNILNGQNNSGSGNGNKEVADYKNMFEKRNIDSGIAQFAKSVRDAFNSGDWAGIGSLFADKINDLINNTDWAGLGTKLGQAVNGMVAAYNSFMEGIHWLDLGSDIATTMNNLISETNWNEVGRALSQKLNAISGTLLGFATNFKWGNAGNEFATTVKGLVNGIDWSQLGKSLGESISGLADWAEKAALNFPWFTIGGKMAQFANDMFASTHWDEIAESLVEVMRGAINSLKEFIAKIKWDEHGEELRKGIRKFIEEFPVFEAAELLQNGLRAALRLMTPVLYDTELFKELGGKFADFLNKLFGNTTMWDDVRKTVVQGAIDAIVALKTFVGKFEWGVNGKTFHDQVLKLVDEFPKTELANLLKEAFKGAIEFIAPTINDIELWKKIGKDTAEFLNSIFRDRAVFKSVGSTINALLGNLFTIGKEFVENFNAVEAGNSIKLALNEIKWKDIASKAWDLLKNAFSKTGTFLNVLLSDESSSRYDPWTKMYVPDESSLGSKIGKTISKAIASIDWKQFAQDLSNGAAKLFNGIADGLKELTKPLKQYGGKSELQHAFEEFFSGINWEQISQSLLNAAREIFIALGQALGGFITTGLSQVFTGTNINSKNMSANDLGTWEAMATGAGQAYGGFDPNKPNPFSGLADLFSAHAAEGEGQYGAGNVISSIDFALDPKIYEQRMNDINTVFTNGWNTINSGAMLAMITFKGYVENALISIKDTIVPTNMNGINTIVSTLIQQTVTLVLQPLNNLVDVGIPAKFTTANGNVTTGFSTIQTTVSTAMLTLSNSVLNTLNNLVTIGVTTKMNTAVSNFSTGWNTILKNASQMAMSLSNSILNTLNNLVTVGVPTKMNTFVEKINEARTKIDNISFTSVGSGMVDDIVNGINNNWNYGTSRASGLASAMYNSANSVNFFNVGYYMVAGVINGIDANLNWLKNAATNAAVAAYNAACAALEIGSPSKLFRDNVGKMIDLGIVEGIKSEQPTVENSIAKMSNAMSDKLYDADLSAALTATASVHYGGMAGYFDDVASAISANTDNSGVDSLVSETSRQNELLREQNRLLQMLVNKDTTVEISTAGISRANERMNRRAGMTIVPVGT